ncbi:hypothetical protein NQ317_017763 [Molorchus minor]|uniref:Uncharacterized protein n=1 Tax=Molorchus minor TaxID=1323400 RepID=A0ABQ9JI97_9CUCU|nr:hypothetical protein NQ317_017763 [Molorchus minor]
MAASKWRPEINLTANAVMVFSQQNLLSFVSLFGLLRSELLFTKKFYILRREAPKDIIFEVNNELFLIRQMSQYAALRDAPLHSVRSCGCQATVTKFVFQKLSSIESCDNYQEMLKKIFIFLCEKLGSQSSNNLSSIVDIKRVLGTLKHGSEERDDGLLQYINMCEVVYYYAHMSAEIY